MTFANRSFRKNDNFGTFCKSLVPLTGEPGGFVSSFCIVDKVSARCHYIFSGIEKGGFGKNATKPWCWCADAGTLCTWKMATCYHISRNRRLIITPSMVYAAEAKCHRTKKDGNAHPSWTVFYLLTRMGVPHWDGEQVVASNPFVPV